MHIFADTHTHTVASTHAYSTLLENIAAAKARGLRALCITEHAPSMPDSAYIWKFYGQRKMLPREVDGVRLISGAEMSVLNLEGEVDLDDRAMADLDWNIASFHRPVLSPATPEEHTRAYEAVVRHPYVDCIGHAGSAEFPFDYDSIAKLCREYNKVIEINANTFTVRRRSIDNCREIAQCCKKHGTSVVVASDAHFATYVGDFEKPLELLREIDFPESLVLNADYDRFIAFVEAKRAEKDRYFGD